MTAPGRLTGVGKGAAPTLVPSGFGRRPDRFVRSRPTAVINSRAALEPIQIIENIRPQGVALADTCQYSVSGSRHTGRRHSPATECQSRPNGLHRRPRQRVVLSISSSDSSCQCPLFATCSMS
jgi:hypothetical protein